MAATLVRDVDGDSQFLGGMNSQTDPLQLSGGTYRTSMNTVNRGGLLQSRPGYWWKFAMPDGQIQGACLFRPLSGVEQLIVAVAGKVYASPYPFVDLHELVNLSFREDAPSIYFCTAEKASAVQPGETVRLITPYKVLIIQDGFTPPGIWDGTTNVHDRDPNGVPLGTCMAWSGNRLWVARRAEIFASDIHDPLSFREGTYLSNARSFLLEKPVVGMVEVTSNGTNDGRLLAFTDSSCTVFKSGIRKRSDWEAAQDFQAVLLPDIGCVAHRSIVSQYGLTWWYSQFGLINLNTALSTYVSSEFQYRDTEMAISKGYLSPGIEKIACAAFENYILTSVPHADVYNTHTWVIDNAPRETVNGVAPASWNSYWTGTRPNDWAFGLVQGVNRIFQFSTDLDGKNRCWEAFTNERTDNGCPIISTLETRGYSKGSLQKKQLRFAEVEFSELQGEVDLAVFWAGSSRGSFKRWMTKEIVATEGIIDDDRNIEDATQFFSFKKQGRLLRTADISESPPQRTACEVESAATERIDSGFQALVIWSGPAAIRSLRMFFDWVNEDKSGKCEPTESGEHVVRYDGSGTLDESDLNAMPEIFTSDQSFTHTLPDDAGSVTGTGSAKSRVSQHDADKIALAHARNAANILWDVAIPTIDGDPDSPLVW